MVFSIFLGLSRIEFNESVFPYQELFIRDSAVAVLVGELEHLADLGLGDVLGQVGHHLAEVGQTEGFLLDLVLLSSELDGMRLRPADGLHVNISFEMGGNWKTF